MLEFSEHTDRDGIIKLWHEAFGDDEIYINTFLNETDFKLLCFTDDGKPVSMLFLLPGEAVSDEIVSKAYYLYAACTLSEYRGRGLMTRLLKEARSYAFKNRASYIFLMPGEESLCEYYFKRGFKCVCFRNEYLFDEIPEFSVNYSNCFHHSDNVYEYAEKMYSVAGFGIFERFGCTLIYSETDNVISIKEWHCSDDRLCDALRALRVETRCRKISVALPVETVITGFPFKRVNHGMLLPIDAPVSKNYYYLDFILD